MLCYSYRKESKVWITLFILFLMLRVKVCHNSQFLLHSNPHEFLIISLNIHDRKRCPIPIKGEETLYCTACLTQITIKHLMLECTVYKHERPQTQ